MIGDGTGVQSGILTDVCLSLPVPLVNILYQTFPIIENNQFLYEHK
jgi:hypothetical protein